MEAAVTVTNAAGPVNLLTNHGSFSDDDAEAFFDNARREQITGTTAAGGAAALIGANDADRLQQAKMIQNSKILFHKLSKSLTTTFEKQIIPEMNKMDEDELASRHGVTDRDTEVALSEEPGDFFRATL